MSKETREVCSFRSSGEYNDAHFEIVSDGGIHHIKVNGEEFPHVKSVTIYFKPREVPLIVIETLVIERMKK